MTDNYPMETQWTRPDWNYTIPYDRNAVFVLPSVDPKIQKRLVQASKVFRKFDKSNKGHINSKEWKKIIRRYKVKKIKKKQLKAAFHAMDLDRNGTVDEREFCEYCSLNNWEFKKNKRRFKLREKFEKLFEIAQTVTEAMSTAT